MYIENSLLSIRNLIVMQILYIVLLYIIKCKNFKKELDLQHSSIISKTGNFALIIKILSSLK